MDGWQTLVELAGVLLAAALAARLSRRYVSHNLLVEQNGALQVYITIVAATYGILVALVFVGQVSNRNDVVTLVTRESSDLLMLLRVSEGLPDGAAKGRIQQHIRGAAEAVVRDEWPLMKRRDVKNAILRYPELSAVWDSILTLDFNDAKTRALAEEGMLVYRQVTENRRMRLLHAEDAIPRVMWIVLIVGGLFFVVHAYLIGVTTDWYHMLLTSMSVGLIFLMLRLIYQYQHPYEGPFAVTPESYTLALERIEQVLR
jgi:hypothetical protein